MHHDDYGVFRDPLSNFLHRAEAAGLGQAVRPVERGQTIDLVPAGTAEGRG